MRQAPARRRHPQPGPRSHRLLPRPATLLIVLVVGLLVAAFGVHGLVNSGTGNDAVQSVHDGNAPQVPASITDGGSVIDARNGRLASKGVPNRTIALTFDDGPDPVWTPQILEVLRKHQVPGTFFVVGSAVAKHPDVVREIRASGSEVGIHTFSHPDLVEVSAERFDRELTETQLALAGATGELSYLVRPPYSSGPDALDGEQLRVVRDLGQRGYVTVLSDIDSRDWERKGVDAILRSATPAGSKGGSVLLHDAGGERSQTVAALDRLIPQLKKAGYRFTTASGSVGLPAANQPASLGDRVLGAGLLSLVGVAEVIVGSLAVALIVVGVLVAARLLIMVVLAGRHRRQRRPGTWSWGAPVRDPVSVVVPAYNESKTIAATVRALAASRHPIEVIVVDDGSTDGTAGIVRRMRVPNVRVIEQPNRGKAAALNAGIAAARHELIVMIDGDTLLEPDTVFHLVQPFARADVGAVAGNAKVANRSGLLTRWQHIEYVIGFNIDRRVFDLLRCMPTIPGAVGAFRRTSLFDVGLVSEDTLAEDTDLTMALCRAGWRVVYEEKARAWTEAPATLSQLWRQRYRWSYGTMQAMWKHRGALVARGAAGRLGRVGLVSLALFQVLLPMLAPLMDIFLLYGLLFLDPVATLLAWAGVLGLQLLAAVYAFRLEGESLRPLWLLPLQQLVYRQLMYAVVIHSVASAFSGIRLRWQKLQRIGDFGSSPAEPDPPTVRLSRPVAEPAGRAAPGR